MVISALRRFIAERLSSGGVEDAPFDADNLVAFGLKMTKTALLINFDREVDSEDEKRICSLADRRISGEPLQYIIGEWEFYGLPFYVGDGVLIPRADTEILVDHAIEFLRTRDNARVIDLCSGSGCIAISVKANLPSVSVSAVELYQNAMGYLTRNVERNGVEIEVINTDVLAEPTGFEKFDAILTNPPYIETKTVKTLSQEVQNEPITALDGGEDGLVFYRSIAKNWAPLLKNDGRIFAEIGEDQAVAVTEIFENHGLKCQTIKDLNGHDRVIIGTVKDI